MLLNIVFLILFPITGEIQINTEKVNLFTIFDKSMINEAYFNKNYKDVISYGTPIIITNTLMKIGDEFEKIKRKQYIKE